MAKVTHAIIIALCLLGCRANGMFHDITSIDISQMSDKELSQVVSIKLTIKKSRVGNRAADQIERISRYHRVYPFIGYDQDNIYIRLMGEFRNMYATLLDLEESL